MKKIAIAALLSAFVATPALADNSGKFYIAGDLGSATYSNASPFPNPGVIRVAGGYHFSPMMAVEVGYSIFGDSTIIGPGGSATLSATSFQVAAVGSLPLNSRFDLTGKIGIANNSYTLTGNIPVWGGFFSGTSSQSDILLGIGAQYHINQQMTLRAQYESFGKFENIAAPMTATAVSLGVAYSF
jgi:OOP family OmpA-OmpF porin